MKHFEIKNLFGGAGGKSKKPKPPTLKPPNLGDYKNIASYSYSEVIDLLSDGPIEGLTNENGYVLNPQSYLQGVYLNDVAVEVSDPGAGSNQEVLNIEFLSQEQCFKDIIKKTFKKINNVPNDGFVKKSKHKTLSEITVSSNKGVINLNYNKLECANDVLNTDVTVPIGDDFKHYPWRTNSCTLYYKDFRNIFDTLEFVDKKSIYSVRPTSASVDNNGYIYFPSLKTQTKIESRPFWFESCGGFYFEFYFNVEKIINENKSVAILKKNNSRYREEIDQALDRILEINKPPETGPATSRFEKEFVKEKLLDLGVKISEDKDADFSYNITKQKLVDLFSRISIYEYSSGYALNIDFFYIGGLARWINDEYTYVTQVPYVFMAIEDENAILEGYIKAEHEDIFINQRYRDITLYDSQVIYDPGSIFAYKGKYYQVIEEWSQTAEGRNPTQELLQNNPKLSLVVLDEPEVNWKNSFQFQSIIDGKEIEKPFFVGDNNLDFIIPQLDENGKWNGKVKGFYMQFFNSAVNAPFIPDGKLEEDIQRPIIYNSLSNKYIDYYSNITGLDIKLKNSNRSASLLAGKFNYSNVLMEFRQGNEKQNPLGFFKNINIDHFYEDQLLGPFSTQQLFGYPPLEGGADPGLGGVQKIAPNQELDKDGEGSPKLNYDSNSIPDMDANFLIAYEETSIDARQSASTLFNYSDWDNARDFDESAQPVTHVIQNPNVKSCFVTLWIKQLSDMYEDSSGGEIGSKKPAVLNIRVEVGLLKEDGTQEKYNDRFFQIIALIESPVILDLGSEDNESSLEYYTDVREVNPFNLSDSPVVTQEGLYTPFILPETTQRTETDTEFKEDGNVKRYIKITKLSTETESSLVKKDVDLLKVTEIIESTCSYPLSALVGIKTDSRVFTEIPKRTYKCKLKKVRLPSNYYPILSNGKDKRYYNNEKDFNTTILEDKLIYQGDWDGSFRFGWTDNPAWILYDMLTSPRYGLGDQINDSQVNKWDLYKIGRFCDAVDDLGYFVGVSDGKNGLEPRFSCNILFSRGINVFDAINSISAIFRGVVYFDNSSISFSDDRLKDPIALFNNSNVKDGFFAYSSARRDEKYNAVEVSYKDRNDGYKSKIEYVENEADIAKRGLFKKEIIAVGITSKAMALRAAKHVMYQTTKEDETISFTTGTEALLCKPGDLIVVEDDLKTLNSNFGRVLSIDPLEGTIRTSETFKASFYNTNITLYIPTGSKTNAELDSIAQKRRERLFGFALLGDTNRADFNNKFSGKYSFSKYSKGYSKNKNGEFDDSLFEINAYEEYAVYTGENSSNPIVWFDTNSTGWVFSINQSFTDNNTYNKYITSGDVFNFITLTSPTTEDEVASSYGWTYNSSAPNKRGSNVFSFSGEFLYSSASDIDYTEGILEEEIEISSPKQIRNFNVTGWGGYKGVQAKEYGDIVYIDKGDISYDLLKFVPEGTTYRFQSKEYGDQVYKIQTIREEENHSYNIIANKYDSGKYSIIENEIKTEKKEDVFGYNQLTYDVNDITYIKLDTPAISNLKSSIGTNGIYKISADWAPIEKATGYKIYIGPSALSQTETSLSQEVSDTFQTYKVKVKALADPFNNNDYNKRYQNSDFDEDLVVAGDPNKLIDDPIEADGGEPS